MRKGMMKGSGKRGYHNKIGKDPMVHSQSAKGIKQPQRINVCSSKKIKERIPTFEEYINSSKGKKGNPILYYDVEPNADGDGHYNVIGKNNSVLDVIYAGDLVELDLDKRKEEYSEIVFDGEEATILDEEGNEIDTYYMNDMVDAYMMSGKTHYKQVSEKEADETTEEHDGYYQ